MKQKLRAFLVCIFAMACIGTSSVLATEINNTRDIDYLEDSVSIDVISNVSQGEITVDQNENSKISPRATGSFDWSIASGITKKGSTSFPMEVGETITINCTFSPRNADLDIGIIAPDGQFYYMSASDGNFDESIEVNESGYYYLAIHNNSKNKVNVKGFVYY